MRESCISKIQNSMTGMRAFHAVCSASDLRFNRKHPNLRIIAVLHSTFGSRHSLLYIGDRSNPMVNNFTAYPEHSHNSYVAVTFF